MRETDLKRGIVSHIDMDGVMSASFVKVRYPDAPVLFLPQLKISRTLLALVRNVDIIYMLDLEFTVFTRNIVEAYPDKLFIIIDHHNSPEEIPDLPNVVKIISKNKSAAELTYSYMGEPQCNATEFLEETAKLDKGLKMSNTEEARFVYSASVVLKHVSGFQHILLEYLTSSKRIREYERIVCEAAKSIVDRNKDLLRVAIRNATDYGHVIVIEGEFGSASKIIAKRIFEKYNKPVILFDKVNPRLITIGIARNIVEDVAKGENAYKVTLGVRNTIIGDIYTLKRIIEKIVAYYTRYGRTVKPAITSLTH